MADGGKGGPHPSSFCLAELGQQGRPAGLPLPTTLRRAAACSGRSDYGGNHVTGTSMRREARPCDRRDGNTQCTGSTSLAFECSPSTRQRGGRKFALVPRRKLPSWIG